jgi:hypothetical protein
LLRLLLLIVLFLKLQQPAKLHVGTHRFDAKTNKENSMIAPWPTMSFHVNPKKCHQGIGEDATAV